MKVVSPGVNDPTHRMVQPIMVPTLADFLPQHIRPAVKYKSFSMVDVTADTACTRSSTVSRSTGQFKINTVQEYQTNPYMHAYNRHDTFVGQDAQAAACMDTCRQCKQTMCEWQIQYSTKGFKR